MKKKDIVKLIELREQLEKDSKIKDVTLYNSSFNYYCSTDNFFPNIENLNSQFDILKEEINTAKKEYPLIQKKISKLPCDHKVRLKYDNSLVDSYECVLCGKELSEALNGETIYNDININKNCVNLAAQYDEDGYVKKIYSIEET